MSKMTEKIQLISEKSVNDLKIFEEKLYGNIEYLNNSFKDSVN